MIWVNRQTCANVCKLARRSDPGPARPCPFSKPPRCPTPRPTLKARLRPLPLFLGLWAGAGQAANPLIHVDQFGYLPSAQKVAVLADPVKGFNATDAYTPGATLEVRRASDQTVVFTGAPQAWKSGKTHGQSGDRAWWLDFSTLTTPGDYYVKDPTKGVSSPVFRIGAEVYDEVLRQAMRTFFYQRVNQAKAAPFADPRWADGASHAGPEQDLDARAMNPDNPAQSDPATGRDLSGGWYDAGDFNKYVNYSDGTLHDLLFAYQERPAAWRDDYGIPESGNGVPDLLDEVQWELDWMLRMQNPDGSLLHKVSSIDWDWVSPPSSDAIPRRYAPATASATISGAATFAHAAKVYATRGEPALVAYAATLRQAALAAWDWLAAHPEALPSQYDNAGHVNAAAEDCLYGVVNYANCSADQQANLLAAAIHLWALTGEARFHDHILAHAGIDSTLLADEYLNHQGMAAETQDALVYYASLPGADPTLAAQIRGVYVAGLSLPASWAPFAPLARFKSAVDPYRAYLDEYLWGSNQSKSTAGTVLWNVLHYGLTTPDPTNTRNAADAYLHYIHGVNPQGMVYLSNMGAYGAERSVPEFYHLWFANGSPLWDNVNTSTYGPAPGFLVGGPNRYWSASTKVYIDGIKDTNHRLSGQPAMKRYWSWNGPEYSFEVTENGIYYQAAYVRLLSKYVAAP